MTPISQNSAAPRLKRIESTLAPDEFHAADLNGPASLWLPQVTDRATLVLGSSQDGSLYRSPSGSSSNDPGWTGVPIIRRRSGGGAVLVSSELLSWFDIWLPANDPRYSTDVSRSFDWLGRTLANVVTSFGHQAKVHNGPMQHSPWSKVICFAGLGPGEITIDGGKAIGISQRRNRDGARYQVAVLRRWDPYDYLHLLNKEHPDLVQLDVDHAAQALRSVVQPLGDQHDLIVESMVRALT